MKGKLTVVPRVVVDQSRPVRHSCNLISVIPPAHHNSILGRVLAKPVVCLTEVVDDVLAAIRVLRREDDGWGRVRAGRHICAVQDEEEEHAQCIGNNQSAGIEPEDSTRSCALA